MEPKSLIRYQSILRALGQALEKLEVKSFELTLSRGRYVVSGTSKKPLPSSPPSSDKKSFLRLIFNGSGANPPKRSQRTDFRFENISFVPREIDGLHYKGRRVRSPKVDGAPEANSLSNILRTVGAYVDYNQGRLQRLSWNEVEFAVCYTQPSGIEAKAIFTQQNLYDHWVHHYKRRKPLRLLKRTGSD